MSGFSPEWLKLREGADHRARDAHLGLKLADRLQKKARVIVRDLGCGTGSNIRATYALLGPEQHWSLVDYDPRLLEAARAQLTAWSDRATNVGDGIELMKSGKRLVVTFVQADLTENIDRALGDTPDLITASALFDLCSTSFIDRFATAVATRRAAFYTVLTFNGIQRWTPKHDLDQPMCDAFCAHQLTDKGFGPSAGPTAPRVLKAAFERAGYRVEEGDSPWLLGRADQPLIDALAPGFADAVAETGSLQTSDVAAWRRIARFGAEVGHTDTFAVPM